MKRTGILVVLVGVFLAAYALFSWLASLGSVWVLVGVAAAFLMVALFVIVFIRRG